MLSLLFIVPLVLSLCVWIFRTRAFFNAALLIHAGVMLSLPASLYFQIGSRGLPGWASPYFHADSLSLFFLVLMTLVYAASAVYSVNYFKHSPFDFKREAIYTVSLILFTTAMAAAILSTHLAFFWVFLELTTLCSAVLIYHDRTKSALEATWKYIFICSIGITLAFVGIVLLSLGSREIGSLFINDLTQHADKIHPALLKIAFAFILVGFGTKIGVAPIHAWLPDAHSEAPSPISALLSGTLLNTALIGFMRFYQIIGHTDAAAFARTIVLGVGFLTLLISAAFMLRTINYKRLLAYSSIENMGIIFIGLGLGEPALYAVMLHTAAHSFAKTGLFLTSGNILHAYGSRLVADVKGLLKRSPVTGWLWLILFFAISGMPPFPIFFSKWMLIQACYNQSIWLTVLFLLLLLIAFGGMAGSIMRMVFGDEESSLETSVRFAGGTTLPQIALIVLSLVIGLSMPDSIRAFLEQAAMIP